VGAIGVVLEFLAPRVQRTQSLDFGRAFCTVFQHEADQILHFHVAAMFQRGRALGRFFGQCVEFHVLCLFLA